MISRTSGVNLDWVSLCNLIIIASLTDIVPCVSEGSRGQGEDRVRGGGDDVRYHLREEFEEVEIKEQESVYAIKTL